MIQIDKCQAITSGNIVSVKHSADLPNGHVINLGGLATDEREVYEVGVPATASLDTAEILIHATPEVMYESGKNIIDFVLKEGKVGRAYHVSVGDIFTVTDDCLDGTTAVGKFLIPQDGSTKLVVADDLSGNTRFAAEIIEKGSLGYNSASATTFRVIKA